RRQPPGGQRESPSRRPCRRPRRARCSGCPGWRARARASGRLRKTDEPSRIGMISYLGTLVKEALRCYRLKEWWTSFSSSDAAPPVDSAAVASGLQALEKLEPAIGRDLPEAYIAGARRRALADGRSLPGRVSGAAIFADISGFTPFTEELADELGSQ